jgi:hypothetical protein
LEPTAQGNAPDVKPVDGQTPVVEQNGVEKRINELTAQRYEAQRRADQAEAREQAYLAQMAELMAQTRAQPAEPAVQIDPDRKREFDAYFNPIKREMENTIRELQKIQGLTAIRQAQHTTSPIQQRAEELTLQYAKNGYRLDPEMALDLAAGQLHRQQISEQNAARAAGRAFNGSGVPVLTTQSMPYAGSTEPQRPDLNKMSIPERMAYWDSQPGFRL